MIEQLLISSLLGMLLYIAALALVIAILLKVTEGMEPITVYTAEKRIHGDPRSVITALKSALRERGYVFDDKGDRIIVHAPLSYIEVYPIMMPSPAVGMKILVRVPGIIVGVVLLALGPIGILLDVLGGIMIYDRFNKVSKLIGEIRP